MRVSVMLRPVFPALQQLMTCRVPVCPIMSRVAERMCIDRRRSAELASCVPGSCHTSCTLTLVLTLLHSTLLPIYLYCGNEQRRILKVRLLIFIMIFVCFFVCRDVVSVSFVPR